ncbi:phage tail tape measure protein, partial [Lelliottia amnigena]|nr:phage tail tape measure protein [Lelliottia amnigena]MBL5937245.1 phage tail tape measure protein [Lelliottia amnigena]
MQGGVTSFANSSQQAFRRIGVGSVALWGVGQAMSGMLEPAREMHRALGTVKSLGVDSASLGMLRDESLKFSMQYGESAADFVKSSYDIQSAISGLSGKELMSFTKASNVLAKATQSDAATITNYVGTMYGIFQNQADAMGKGAWIDTLAGKTAYAVNLFKTTGTEMSGAFSALGANAQAFGIDLNEQLAVLGKLQTTMTGSEAGTKYKAFLAGVGGAQKALGLKFTDSQGKMLGVVPILEKIRGKFGDLSKVADSDTLKKAFGSDEAVSMIKLMIGNIDGLKTSISNIGNVDGIQQALTMAEAMTDPFDRLTHYFEAIKIVIGSTLLPILFPYMNAIADTGATMMRWQKLFPGLTRAVGLLAAGLLFFAAAGAIANITMGISKFIWIGLKGIWFAADKILKIHTISMWLWNKTLKATRAVTLALSISTYAFGGAVNFALWPVLLIIGALAALAVGAWYLYEHWDLVKASIADSQAFQALMGVIDTVSGYFSQAWESIANGWKWLTDQFS